MALPRPCGVQGNLLSHKARRNWQTVASAVRQALAETGVRARAGTAVDAALTHLAETLEPEAFLRSFRTALGKPVRTAAPAPPLPPVQDRRRKP
jgi:hypothetical protein